MSDILFHEPKMQSPSILILTTGGTIDKQYFDALSQYQITDSMVTKVLSVGLVTHPYRVVEIARKDSLDLTDEDRAKLVACVRSSKSSRVIVTHGTDTMTITADALAGISDKTIVLVGALSPARFSESDAAFNLGMAFATVQTATPGVYITMNGSVFNADTVTKDRSQGQFVLKSSAARP